MWQTDQPFDTVGSSFGNSSTVAVWLETTVAERAQSLLTFNDGQEHASEVKIFISFVDVIQ